MWIMECEHHSHGLLKNHTTHNTNNNNSNPLPVKLRPLMPRPALSLSSPLSTIAPSSRSFRNPNLTAWNNQSLFSGESDYGLKRLEKAMSSAVPPLVSTRWNPTPEQVQALEEMYRKGTRTPSAEQIQQIAAKLRRFGKIEGKNVFYWFQNHKARERQKKRRREMELLTGRKMLRREDESTPGTQSGLSSSYLEFEHPKTLLISSNCSTTLQYSASAGPVGEELCQKDRCAKAAKSTEFNCCQLDLSCCLSPNNSMDNIAAAAAAAATAARVKENQNPCVEFNLFCPKNVDLANLDGCGINRNDQTLELFPVKGNDLGNNNNNNNNNSNNDIMENERIGNGFSNVVGTSLVPNQFFEFLPTKN